MKVSGDGLAAVAVVRECRSWLLGGGGAARPAACESSCDQITASPPFLVSSRACSLFPAGSRHRGTGVDNHGCCVVGWECAVDELPHTINSHRGKTRGSGRSSTHVAQMRRAQPGQGHVGLEIPNLNRPTMRDIIKNMIQLRWDLGRKLETVTRQHRPPILH